jgi:hypothetical protein
MAAQHDIRLCLCGCGRDISHLRGGTKYAEVCRYKAMADAQFEREKKRRARVAMHLVPQRVQPRVKRELRDKAGNPIRPAELKCKVCAGMPWRITERRPCKGCGESYEREMIEPPSLLVSSAGTAVSHGNLYGHQGNGSIENGSVRDRPGRRKVK